MSMMGAKDNETHSYLEVVDAVRQHGARIDADLQELWRRIVFYILISNLRNIADEIPRAALEVYAKVSR
jgi:hypothetical protein